MNEARTRVSLVPRRWVRLPGTNEEVYLHGRRLLGETVTLHRTWMSERVGGWDLSPVWGCCYVRRASQPEAVTTGARPPQSREVRRARCR